MTETAWNRLSAAALRALAANDAIVLLPVASTEQHGPHLATGVDDFLCSQVCRRAADKLSPRRAVVVTPTVWFGLADHHVAFGGTFSISLATYHAVLRDVCRSILQAGFRRIVLVNGHGGNIQALAVIAGELTRELAAPVATVTYFMEGTAEAAGILEDQNGVMHACEAETSMMMATDPDLVDRTRLNEAHGPAFDIAGSLQPSLKRFRSFSELTGSGVAGDARKASEKKGEALLEVYAEALSRRLLEGEPWGDIAKAETMRPKS
jgi:creatinine amidohydrolase